MSRENNPNINAAGLVIDLFSAINKHSRGNAKKAGRAAIIQAVADAAARFSTEISIMLDEKFGVE